MRTALTIAGSDPSAGAGIQADLKTFAAFGVYGATAITAVTVQNTQGVEQVMPLPADIVAAQMEAVASDITIHATKIGMLANAAIVEAVAAAIDELELSSVVLDPVLVASDGRRLLDEDGEQALRLELLKRARVVTPNVPEAEALSGMRIQSPDDVRTAARRIHALGPRAVVVTGGHAAWAADRVVDVLFDGDAYHEFVTPRANLSGAHGTGCTYAAALAAALALDIAVTDAARDAQQFVAGALAQWLIVGRGRPVLDHFWSRGARP